MINEYKPHIDRLKSSGLRPTKQRLAICKILFSGSETFHFSIENLKKIVEKNTKNKKFLDIGSASGICLKAIKDLGFQEEGYEPSKWMVNYGRIKYQVNLKSGTINDVDINNKYDLIINCEAI